MPLQPAYSWSETETTIKISIENIPIKDRGQLFCSDRLVKLNVPPYLLLLDLKHAVDDGASTATIIKGRKIVINMVKAEPGPWQKLVADGNVAVIRKQREDSVQRAHQKLLTAQQQKQARKQAEERAAVDLQIQQQKAQRDQLEAFKQQELQEERQELQQWQQELKDQGDESDYEEEPADAAAQVISHGDQQACAQGSIAAPGHHSSSSSTSTEEAYHGRGWWPSKAADTSSADPSGCAVTGSGSNDDSSSNNSSLSSGTLQHLTASPAHKAADACQAVTTLLDSAATGRSTADEPFITTSSTRRLSAGPSYRTEDSQTSTAAAPGTTSITDSTSSKPSRPVAPVRSRVAPVPVTFTQLETPHLPAREQREVEIKQIKKAAGKADSLDLADRQPAFLKDKGDAFAAQGNYMGAVNAYSKALELEPTQATLWANRAAAHLALGQAAECVQDCSTAIEMVAQAHAKALQAAPGTAAELELQAGMMLGAASASACVTEHTPPAVSTGQQQPEPSSNECSDGPVAAVEIAEASNGEEASQCGTEANAADKATQAGRDAQQHGCSSSSAGGCSSDSSTRARSDSSSSARTQAVSQAEQLPDASMAAKLQQLLVKLLARRAAAHVELQQLQEAADDLQHALRLDPTSHRLQADALEVSLALNPHSSHDPAAIKELAAARFKAGDLAGAAEAFTALAELLQQQQQQQQDQAEDACGPEEQQEGASEGCDEQAQQQQQRLLLTGALSNRAACRLGLNMHTECVQDCWAAFRALWPAAASSSAGLPDQPGGSSEEASPSSRLELHPPSRLLQLTGSRAAAQSAARTVGRLAAAYGCLKDVPAADAAFGWAAACWQLLGEHARVQGVLADQARLHQSAAA